MVRKWKKTHCLCHYLLGCTFPHPLWLLLSAETTQPMQADLDLKPSQPCTRNSMENFTMGQQQPEATRWHGEQNNPWMCSPGKEGFPISLECLLCEGCHLRRTLSHPVLLGDAWRGDPAHRRAFMPSGSRPIEINKSVTVHSSPQPSQHSPGRGKKSSQLLLNARELQSEEWPLIWNSLCLGVSLRKATFSASDLQIPLWPLACWKRAKYLKWSQANCFFKHFSEIRKSS